MKSVKSSGLCKSFINTDLQSIYRGVLKARLITVIQQLGFIRAVSCSAQNSEWHLLHVHIILTAEHFNFHEFYKNCELQYDLMFCSNRLMSQRQ